jgi:hypothetical protein
MYKIARLPVEQGAKACFVRRNKGEKKRKWKTIIPSSFAPSGDHDDY